MKKWKIVPPNNKPHIIEAEEMQTDEKYRTLLYSDGELIAIVPSNYLIFDLENAVSSLNSMDNKYYNFQDEYILMDEIFSEGNNPLTATDLYNILTKKINTKIPMGIFRKFLHNLFGLPRHTTVNGNTGRYYYVNINH